MSEENTDYTRNLIDVCNDNLNDMTLKAVQNIPKPTCGPFY